MPGQVRLKRVYDDASDADGTRVLVDRLWPRGIGKDKARIDRWLKDVSPSDELRKRFHGNPSAWKEFAAAYAAELKKEPWAAAAKQLKEMIAAGPVTLLYAARDEERNNAVALRDWLKKQRK